ncbi:hypothetical protein Hdeb2414_s0015g00450681 [Helianthus debilis subsp. tardiflorus]
MTDFCYTTFSQLISHESKFYKTYVLAGIFMLTYFHMCFRYSSWCYMMMILVYAHLGMEEALVTLKDARLVNYVMFLCC